MVVASGAGPWGTKERKEAQGKFLEGWIRSNLDWSVSFTNLTCQKSPNRTLKICEFYSMYIDCNKSFIIEKVKKVKRKERQLWSKAHFKRNCAHPPLWPALLVDCIVCQMWVEFQVERCGVLVGCWSYDDPVELCGGLQCCKLLWSLAYSWSWGSLEKW